MTSPTPLERGALMIEHRATANVPQINEDVMNRDSAFNVFALIVGAILPIALVVVVLLL
jgi:hypothetical protein